MELVCPAGSLPALRAAVDSGADCVYLGLRDDTNARNFAGLNFDVAALDQAVAYAHARGRKVLLAVNTYPQPDGWTRWTGAIDLAADHDVDATILADLGLMEYAATRHPQLRLHLSVQGSATTHEAINLYRRLFGVQRAVLPRVLAIQQVEQLVAQTEVEIEVFGFGGLCVMVEGRCQLSSYVTGESPNTAGACSPARAVRWEQTPRGLESRLGGIFINRFGAGENAAYPTLCKGRFEVAGDVYYAIEGRQRSPAYVAQVTRVWRAAIDACHANAARFAVRPDWEAELRRVSEGRSQTLGAYHRPWK
jgi:putative protease